MLKKPSKTHSRFSKIAFESMEQCASATGIPKTIQQLAKSNGCMAFRGPRIYLIELLNWIFKQAGSGNFTDWGSLGVELDTKLKQVRLETELRELIERTEADEVLQAFAVILFNGIKRLEMESLRDFEMRDRDFIKTAFAEKRRVMFDQAKNELKKLLAEAE